MSTNKITVQATINAQVTKVWDYWTQPQHITNWTFASDDWCCPSATNDLKAGGKFTTRMESKDGKMGFDFEGIYDEVIDKQKIAYSLADGRKIEVLFEQQGNQTLVTEVFDPENQNPAEMQQAGWQAILNNFKKYVEAN